VGSGRGFGACDLVLRLILDVREDNVGVSEEGVMGVAGESRGEDNPPVVVVSIVVLEGGRS